MGQPIGTILEVTIKYTVNTQVNLNILHYVVSTQSTLTTPENEIGQFQSDFISPTGLNFLGFFRPLLAPNATLNTTRYQWVFPLRRAFALLNHSVAGTGTYGTCTAQNVAAVVTKTTALAGRDQVGSFHLGGVGINGYSAGNLQAPYKTDVVNNLLPFLISSNIATVGGGVYAPILWHRSNQTFNQNYNILQAVELRDTLRVMRRRTVGYGI